MYGLCGVWTVWCIDCVVYGLCGVWTVCCMDCVVYGLCDVWTVCCMDCVLYGLCVVWTVCNTFMYLVLRVVYLYVLGATGCILVCTWCYGLYTCMYLVLRCYRFAVVL